MGYAKHEFLAESKMFGRKQRSLFNFLKVSGKSKLTGLTVDQVKPLSSSCKKEGKILTLPTPALFAKRAFASFGRRRREKTKRRSRATDVILHVEARGRLRSTHAPFPS